MYLSYNEISSTHKNHTESLSHMNFPLIYRPLDPETHLLTGTCEGAALNGASVNHPLMSYEGPATSVWLTACFHHGL